MKDRNSIGQMKQEDRNDYCLKSLIIRQNLFNSKYLLIPILNKG